MNGTFTWVDLSTFDLSSAQQFYHHVLGWDYAMDESGYITCSAQGFPSAGLYEMPAFFQKINMPSFWMTYIAVDDIDRIVGRAKQLGGKVELTEKSDDGKVALIRDPAGAGFTCYEGNLLRITHDAQTNGRWCWSELFVSDLSTVKSFYTALFDWQIEAEGRDRYSIIHQQQGRIGAIQVADNSIKGEKEFWAVNFTTDNLHQAKTAIEQAGGQAIDQYDNTDGQHLLAYDDQGAAFFLTIP